VNSHSNGQPPAASTPATKYQPFPESYEEGTATERQAQRGPKQRGIRAPAQVTQHTRRCRTDAAAIATRNGRGSRLMGRVSTTPVVETVRSLSVPELRALALQQGGGPARPGAVVVNLVTRSASTLLPNSRVVFVLCPECGSCHRALFWLGGRLACRRCHRLRYQSQTHGHWTGPLLDKLQARRRLLAGRPGPKGRRYRAWMRRVERVEGQVMTWLDRWEQRWGPRFRRETDIFKRLMKVNRQVGRRF
jgi:hypothetical protein